MTLTGDLILRVYADINSRAKEQSDANVPPELSTIAERTKVIYEDKKIRDLFDGIVLAFIIGRIEQYKGDPAKALQAALAVTDMSPEICHILHLCQLACFNLGYEVCKAEAEIDRLSKSI